MHVVLREHLRRAREHELRETGRQLRLREVVAVLQRTRVLREEFEGRGQLHLERVGDINQAVVLAGPPYQHDRVRRKYVRVHIPAGRVALQGHHPGLAVDRIGRLLRRRHERIDELLARALQHGHLLHAPPPAVAVVREPLRRVLEPLAVPLAPGAHLGLVVGQPRGRALEQRHRIERGGDGSHLDDARVALVLGPVGLRVLERGQHARVLVEPPLAHELHRPLTVPEVVAVEGGQREHGQVGVEVLGAAAVARALLAAGALVPAPRDPVLRREGVVGLGPAMRGQGRLALLGRELLDLPVEERDALVVPQAGVGVQLGLLVGERGQRQVEGLVRELHEVIHLRRRAGAHPHEPAAAAVLHGGEVEEERLVRLAAPVGLVRLQVEAVDVELDALVAHLAARVPRLLALAGDQRRVDRSPPPLAIEQHLLARQLPRGELPRLGGLLGDVGQPQHTVVDAVEHEAPSALLGVRLDAARARGAMLARVRHLVRGRLVVVPLARHAEAPEDLHLGPVAVGDGRVEAQHRLALEGDLRLARLGHVGQPPQVAVACPGVARGDGDGADEGQREVGRALQGGRAQPGAQLLPARDCEEAVAVEG
eukprot:scaffold40810_cov64-Phaeocystis_antarctica.AAC.1